METSRKSLKRACSSKTPSNIKTPRIEPLNSANLVEDDHIQFHEDIRCSICSEILMKAVTLNCSHTYCKHCIDRWMAKQSDCPICRAKIVYQVPTLILDNIIGKIVQTLPKSIQKHREKVMAERDKKIGSPKTCKNKSGWIKMRRMNGLSSYYMIPTYVNARRHLNDVTIMYFEDDPEWEDLRDDCHPNSTSTEEFGTSYQEM